MRLAWMFPPGPKTAAALPLYGCPAVDGAGQVLVCIQNRLFAMTAESKVVWQVALGGAVPGSPVIGPDGNIRVHAADGLLYCIDPTGRPCWPAALVGPPLGWATPLVDASNRTWVCAARGGLLRVEATGRCSPYYASEKPLNSTGVVVGNILYVGGEDSFVHAIALDSAQGRNLWDSAAGKGWTGWFINSALALRRDGLVIVASRANYVYAFQRDGTEAWRFRLPWQILGSPVLDESDNLYLGVSDSQRGKTSRGLLLCVDGKTRKQRWTFSAGGSIESTPVLGSDGFVYFGDNAGVFYQLNRETGEECGKISTNPATPVRSAGALIAPGRVAFGIDSGKLIVLECPSPALGTGWSKLLGGASNRGW